MDKKVVASEVGMIIVTILWGSNYVVGKLAMGGGLTANFYTAFRFCGAALVLALVFPKHLRALDRETLKAGIYIGIAVGVGYILQTIGLDMTTASKAGFLTGLYVVLVPLFDCLLKRALPKGNEVVGIVLATVGLAVLSLNSDFSIGLGEVIVFISAVSFAVSIILIDRYSGPCDPINLSILQIAVTGVMALALAFATEPVPDASIFDLSMVLLVAYVILFGSAVNTTVQTVAQSYIPPIAAALILVLEPIFSGVFGFLLLQDPMGAKELGGSALIIAGMLITLVYKPRSQRAGEAA